jgi:SAM-dependent methyltransferase
MQAARFLQRLGKVASGKSPLKAAYYAAMIRLSRSYTDRRRFEFEKLYAEDGDPWGYFSRPYELEKYRRTRDVVLRYCPAKASALEVGCSVGVFTKMIAPSFDSVVAIDISAEAAALAAKTVAGVGNVEVRSGDFLALEADGRTFDAIFFAEVLYYIDDAQGPDVCQALNRLLSERGVFVVVHPAEGESGGWKGIFGQAFDTRAAVTIQDPERPYEISVYGRRNARREAGRDAVAA